jgi:hypothetical protein
VVPVNDTKIQWKDVSDVATMDSTDVCSTFYI